MVPTISSDSIHCIYAIIIIIKQLGVELTSTQLKYYFFPNFCTTKYRDTNLFGFENV